MRTYSINKYAAACLLCAQAVFWSLPLRAADALPAAQGRVVLTVTGDITRTNNQGPLNAGTTHEAEFDLALLNSLPQHEFSTETPWTEGVHHFRGVLVQDLLQRVGATSGWVKAVALNAYYHEFDSSSPELASLLLTTHLDGKPMKIRDKGPVWLMLPLSEYSELDTKRYYELLIWQLKTLDVGHGKNL